MPQNHKKILEGLVKVGQSYVAKDLEDQAKWEDRVAKEDQSSKAPGWLYRPHDVRPGARVKAYDGAKTQDVQLIERRKDLKGK